MDGAAIVRLRWRLHGAWMWPAFVVLTLVDAAIGHWLPPAGEGWSPVGAWLLSFFLSLVGIVVVAPALAAVLRRVRGDMPKVVARDYAGTGVVLTVTVLLLAAGLVHHASVAAGHRAMEDAVARAEAYIGDHAPSDFRRNLRSLTTYELQPGTIYRTCARNRGGTRSWCVIVNRGRPFAHSVTFAGSEPNALFSRGAW
jgi:hypothetical protein